MCRLFVVVLFFFFFFKQKTAYEMRISDWSSDVCSSDLPIERSAFAVDGAYTVATVRIRLATTGQAKFKQLGLDRLRLYLDGESPLVHALYELQIGRASCRERVCQYV